VALNLSKVPAQIGGRAIVPAGGAESAAPQAAALAAEAAVPRRRKGDPAPVAASVGDIETEVAALKARGVVFEEYDLPSLKTINSVALMGPVKIAWMKDTEGNLMSLAQFI
jgi:hypothetical protein